MTGLSNADVVAQLGWTLQVIYDSTGGRICRFWRPPYGDVDLRVDAIAREVFGLKAVVWNHEYVPYSRVICTPPNLASALRIGTLVTVQ